MVKNGYEPQEVDTFIRGLEEAIVFYKMKEQYISQALVESQIASKKIIEEAEIRAFQIEKKALIQMEHLKQELNNTKKRLLNFKNEYDTFMDNFKSSFSESEMLSFADCLDELATTISTSEKENI
jgi:CRISPR/Cas system-associated protein Cas5 (RAMP superfamily)